GGTLERISWPIDRLKVPRCAPLRLSWVSAFIVPFPSPLKRKGLRRTVELDAGSNYVALEKIFSVGISQHLLCQIATSGVRSWFCSASFTAPPICRCLCVVVRSSSTRRPANLFGTGRVNPGTGATQVSCGVPAIPVSSCVSPAGRVKTFLRDFIYEGAKVETRRRGPTLLG